MLKHYLLVLTYLFITLLPHASHAVIKIITDEGHEVFITEEHELFLTEETLATDPPFDSSATTVNNNSLTLSPLTALANEAITLKAGCLPAETNGTIRVIPKGAAVIPLGDEFYVIPTPERVETSNTWLAPNPGAAGKTSIHGIDRDRDCVRDDIENYIVQRFSHSSQKRIRRYFFEYAIWLNQFLSAGISQKTAQSATVEMAKAGLCLNRLLGNSRSEQEINALTFEFHNTWGRVNRYIDNLKPIAGWTHRNNITESCP